MSTTKVLNADEIKEAFEITELTEKERERIRKSIGNALTYDTTIGFIANVLESIEGEHSRIDKMAYVVHMAYVAGYVGGVEVAKDTEIKIFNELFAPTA